MGQGASSAADADLIALFARRLDRLARLKGTLRDAGLEEGCGWQLVRLAMRSTLVDLARLGQAELAVAVVARARPSRSGRRATGSDRRTRSARASGGRTPRPSQ